MIEIKDHGGKFGGKSSGLPKAKINPFSISAIPGSTIKLGYALGLSKSFIVAHNNSGSIYILDKKTLKHLKTIAAHPFESGAQIRYDFNGIIVADRYLIYSVINSDGSTVTMWKVDLLAPTNMHTQLTPTLIDTLYCSKLSADGSYGYIAGYNRIYKINSLGNIVWMGTDSNDGGYANGIYGEFNGKVYTHSNSGYIKVINASTGATLNSVNGFSNAISAAEFITNGKLICVRNNNVYIKTLDANGLPSSSAVTTILNYRIGAAPYSKDGTKIIISKSVSASAEAVSGSSDVYDLNGLRLEHVASNYSIGNVKQILPNERVCIHDTFGSSYATYNNYGLYYTIIQEV